MQIDVTGSGEEELLNLKLTPAEGQILLTMIGAYRDDITLLKQWKEELEDAGVERGNYFVAAISPQPILFFSDEE